MSRKFKRFLSIMMVAAMVIAMAAACGKKEEAAAPEELEVETEVTVSEGTKGTKEDAQQKEETASNEKMKSEADTLTDDDIQNLKASIRDTVISEYIEPNNMSIEEFAWPDSSDSEAWEHFAKLVEYSKIEYETGAKMPKSESELTDAQKVMEAAFKGIINWLDTQGNYDGWYFVNTMSTLDPYPMTISTIDITSK